MIDYKLAKKLKGAGYNLKPVEKGNWNGNRAFFLEDNTYYAPTLSELIEACGDRFAALRYSKKHYFGGHDWVANADEQKNGSYSMAEMGDTPEEATGKLYIALNS